MAPGRDTEGSQPAASDGSGFQDMGLFADLLVDSQEPSDVDLFGMLLPMDVDPNFTVTEGVGQEPFMPSAAALERRVEDDAQFESYAAQLDGLSHGLWASGSFDLANGALATSPDGGGLPPPGLQPLQAKGAAPGSAADRPGADAAAMPPLPAQLLPDPAQLLGVSGGGAIGRHPSHVSQAQSVLARLQDVQCLSQPTAAPRAAEAGLQGPMTTGWSAAKGEAAEQKAVSLLQEQHEQPPQQGPYSNNVHPSSSGSGEAEHVDQGAEASKGVKSHDQALKLLSELKDRSRESQRRYRARRKDKLAQTEERVAQLEAQVQALTFAKEELASQNEVLKDFVRTQRSNEQQQQEEKLAKPAPTAGLGMCDGSNWLDEHTKLLIQRVAGLDGTEVVLTVRDPAAPLRIPQAQLAQISRDDMYKLGREYVHAIADALVAARNDPDSPAGQRIASLMREVSAIKGSIVIAQPSRMTRLAILSSQEPGSDALKPAASPEILREVIRDLGLSERQVRALLRMRRLYLENLGALMRRRQELSVKLQAAVHTGSGQGALGEVQLYVTALMERIRDTLRAERTFDFQFLMTMWFRVFTPIQAARTVIHSNTSARLDGLLIVNQLAEEHGDPPAKDLLSEGAMRTDRILLPVDAAATLA